jgi:hypothetical protein
MKLTFRPGYQQTTDPIIRQIQRARDFERKGRVAGVLETRGNRGEPKAVANRRTARIVLIKTITSVIPE